MHTIALNHPIEVENRPGWIILALVWVAFFMLLIINKKVDIFLLCISIITTITHFSKRIRRLVSPIGNFYLDFTENNITCRSESTTLWHIERSSIENIKSVKKRHSYLFGNKNAFEIIIHTNNDDSYSLPTLVGEKEAAKIQEQIETLKAV